MDDTIALLTRYFSGIFFTNCAHYYFCIDSVIDFWY